MSAEDFATMGNSMSYDNNDNVDNEGSPQQPRHTQFLDLTNGEGGEASATSPGQQSDGFYEGGDDEDDGGGDAEPETQAPPPVAESSVPVAKLDPGTPGKVVETGQEHTGRWTREEHAAFLSALKMYGKEWKKVAAKVKTRTVVQTRTHAQKYFQKLQKAIKTNESVEMGVDPKQKALAQKRKQLQQLHAVQQAAQKPKPTLVRTQSAASTQAAAHLMANLSSAGSGGLSAATPLSFGTSSSFASAPYSAAQIAAPPPNFSHGFSSASSNTTNQSDQPLLAPPQALPNAYGSSGGFFGRPSGSSSMSIVAPEHDIAARMGKFPEPSPAATGKRKLAEIAAAQMLAGVMGKKESVSGTTPPPPEGMPDLGIEKSGGMSLQIVNPESLGVTYEESSKRKRGPGGSSPTTPWDGDLEAFVRYVVV
jgi:SHAQKYF class myb-like DNA-binding protein